MLWDAIGISKPGVVACVGAGGKTSLVQTLAEGAMRRDKPVVVTTTTKMFDSQVASFQPVLSEDLAKGLAKVTEAVGKRQVTAWLARRDGEKVFGVCPEWLDTLAAKAPDTYILVEADGASRCLIKAPAAHEPVIPACTAVTVGVLNIGVLGQPLATTNAHRLNLVANIINKQAGNPVEWQDLARLATHRQGIFQYARGARVLLLSGGGSGSHVAAAQIAGYCRLAKTGIDRIVVTTGYGCSMQPIEVYRL